MKLEEMENYELNRKLYTLATGLSVDTYSIARIDYCIDWNATMPLAIEHGISICIYFDVCEVSYEHSCSIGSFGTNENAIYHIETTKENALKAVVFCLIKKLESKK